MQCRFSNLLRGPLHIPYDLRPTKKRERNLLTCVVCTWLGTPKQRSSAIDHGHHRSVRSAVPLHRDAFWWIVEVDAMQVLRSFTRTALRTLRPRSLMQISFRCRFLLVGLRRERCLDHHRLRVANGQGRDRVDLPRFQTLLDRLGSYRADPNGIEVSLGCL